MENFVNLLNGIEFILDIYVLFYCFVGVLIGTFVGVLPGIGVLAAISLLLPFTYQMPTITAIVMLAGVYYGAQYGGSIASILLNLPGTPASAVACLDGYPMSKNGKAGIALFMTAIASFIGAMIGIFVLMIFSEKISNLGLRFGPAEYFLLMMLGLIASSTLVSNSPNKGLSMMVFGLLVSSIGIDINSGISRFDFGLINLMNGVSLIVVVMGIFGLVEIIKTSNNSSFMTSEKITTKSMMPSFLELKRSLFPILRGSCIGSFFGILPGTGPTIASFTAYAVEKKISSEPNKFGNGAIEGLVSSEAANNSASHTGFIPTLMLGIPGDAVMAIIIAALIMHGVQPGPMMLIHQNELIWGLIASFFVGNILLLILNVPLIGFWISILRIPYHFLYPSILIFICIGVYSVNQNVFDIFSVAVIGIIAYILYNLDFDFVPFLLGFVLGQPMEENFRRSLLISDGSFMIFFNSFICLSILSLILIVILMSIIKFLKIRRINPPVV